MWSVIQGKLSLVFGGVFQLAQDRPVECALYFVPLIILFLWLCRALWRQEGQQAYWLAAIIVLLNVVFSWGDDTYTHTYRIVALAEQVRHGEFGMLLTNPTTGQVLPVFTFYSVLPYLAPTALNLVGVPAVVAFKLTLVVLHLTLAFGLQALVMTQREGTSARRPQNAEWLIAGLFLFANYVYALWCTRAAFAEIWVYSFIPWVVTGIVTGYRTSTLTGLFFLQACGHPIVLVQSLVCTLVAPLCLSRLSLGELIRRSLVPLFLAILLAAPFWLPQFLWKDFILGPEALPNDFLASFLRIDELLNPRDFRAIGPWLPLSFLALLFFSRGRLDGRVWTVAVVWLVVMAVQSVYLGTTVAQVPVLNMSVFIWRFMLPASFLAFAILLAGWRQAAPTPAWMPAILLPPAILAMIWVSLGQAPRYFVKLADSGNDRSVFVDYDKGDGVWGIKEFLPRYAGLPQHCPPEADVQKVSYAAIRKGFVAERPFVSVKDGPTGFVQYDLGGNEARSSACSDSLVLGPLRAGQRLSVGESWLNVLFYMRSADLLAVILVVFALGGGRRRNRSTIAL